MDDSDIQGGMNSLAHNFLGMIISFHYMFRATMCPSSGEITVYMRHLVLVILYGLLSDGTQGGMNSFHPAYHTVIYTDRHVEKRNKRTKKNCAPSCLYLQDCLETNSHFIFAAFQ